MTSANTPEQLLIARIRRGDEDAWQRLVDQYEGRLTAFCESRLGQRSAAEDVVQDTFIGFLASLPNYDTRRSLEGYLFSICSYKLIDLLRHEGRRPALPFSAIRRDPRDSFHVPAVQPSPSSYARSAEYRVYQEGALVTVLAKLLNRWKSNGEWQKLKCLELLFVRGRSNQQIAQRLGLTEQQVANYKSDFVIQLRRSLKKQGLPTELFPELHSEGA